jgi:hypothetical protein
MTLPITNTRSCCRPDYGPRVGTDSPGPFPLLRADFCSPVDNIIGCTGVVFVQGPRRPLESLHPSCCWLWWIVADWQAVGSAGVLFGQGPTRQCWSCNLGPVQKWSGFHRHVHSFSARALRSCRSRSPMTHGSWWSVALWSGGAQP